MTYALIFDVDGVVADTESLNARASIAMFKELYGLTVQPEDFIPFVGHGDERYTEGVAEQYGITIDTETAVRRRHRIFAEMMERDPLPASPGLLSLVQAAREDPEAGLAIATSGRRDKQIPVIENAGLCLAWFDVVITGNDVTHKKPHPQIYELTGRQLGLPARRCVVFEDAPAGVASAKAAGMVCVGLAGTVPAQDLADADVVVSSLEELTLEAIRKLT